MSLHLISNGKMSFEELGRVAEKVNLFVDYFHIREKQKTAREIFDGISLLVKVGIPAEKIIVNDRIDVALSLSLKGVQLAHHSLPVDVVRRTYSHLMIGCSTHSLKEVQDVESGGATFALFGHIFSTSSKPGIEPRGCEVLKEISNQTAIPLIAIGGIVPENVSTVLKHGASGVAVMSGILEHDDPYFAAMQYKLAINKWKEVHHEKSL